jgi:uncharacterized Rossmann fold enzyme
MDLVPFTIKTQCALPDEELYRHIEQALARHLPEVSLHPAHTGTAVLVASGPSVLQEIEAIRHWKDDGAFVVAVKDTHDWLLANGVVPHAAVAIDPTQARAHVFAHPHPDVQYLIASQVHPDMLDHLTMFHVELWHLYVRKGQTMPHAGIPMIGGGTTTGLRTIVLLYAMGFRTIELYGFDSCLQDGVLRMNGTRPKETEQINTIVAEGQTFFCNPAMTSQAKEFQSICDMVPDMTMHAHGEGLIQTILRARQAMPLRTVSFLHHGGPSMASYRYRAQIPAEHLGASINDLTADVVIVSKPESVTVSEVKQMLGRGQSVIVDFCDDHFTTPHYRDLLRLADTVVCNTPVMQQTIAALGREALVIDDPYEYPEQAPHCQGAKLLWFGHALNRPTLDFPNLHCVSNAPGDIPWSIETMRTECARADIVLIPETAPYKSANRTIEAIRHGCFVVAEPHPSLTDIPGIWIGDLQEGITWASTHWIEANARIRHSQIWVSQRFAPRIVAGAWSQCIRECPSTWGQVVAAGPIGSLSISTAPMSVAT